jgi:hypothetical protein
MLCSAVLYDRRHVRRAQPDSGAGLGQHQARSSGLYLTLLPSFLAYVCLLARFRRTLPNILTSCQSGLLSSATTVPDCLNTRSFSQNRQGYNKHFRTFMLLW